MNPYPELPDRAFTKADSSSDLQFYDEPRLVHHIDDPAVAAVTALYRTLLPPGGVIVDVMSSWVSHLPDDAVYAEVIGQGMNAAELAANPRLDRWFVQDLNQTPELPLPDGSADAVCQCVGVQYLQRPAEVYAGLRRVLRPNAPIIVTFSNRCFPTKAVAIWQALTPADQQRLVGLYLTRAGFVDVQAQTLRPGRGSDPLWAVCGRVPPAGSTLSKPTM